MKVADMAPLDKMVILVLAGIGWGLWPKSAEAVPFALEQPAEVRAFSGVYATRTSASPPLWRPVEDNLPLGRATAETATPSGGIIQHPEPPLFPDSTTSEKRIHNGSRAKAFASTTLPKESGADASGPSPILGDGPIIKDFGPQGLGTTPGMGCANPPSGPGNPATFTLMAFGFAAMMIERFRIRRS